MAAAQSGPYPIYDRSGVDDGPPELLGELPDLPRAPLEAPAFPLDQSVDGKRDVLLDRSVVRRAGLTIAAILATTVASLGVLGAVSLRYPPLGSSGLIAFTLGLRHGVDADHIAAIDNVSRKLLADGQLPLLVGLYFSLGHSTVVVVLCVLVTLLGSTLAPRIDELAGVGSVIGVLVSTTMLLLVGCLNLALALNTLSAWLRARARGGAGAEDDAGAGTGLGTPRQQLLLHEHDGQPPHAHIISLAPTADGSAVGARADEGSMGGLFLRCACCARLLARVDRAWKLCPVGVLFGLGFDTASEVALLSLAAAAPGRSAAPPAAALVLPLVFTAGMSLVDTCNGVLMLWAYGWAGLQPGTRLCFTASLTLASALLALSVAAVQTLAFLREHVQPTPTGGLWDAVAALDEHNEWIGAGAICAFVLALVGAIIGTMLCTARDQRGLAARHQRPAALGATESDLTQLQPSSVESSSSLS